MPSFMKLAAAALAMAAPLVSAQTYSDCNPMEKTCPANPGSTESNLHFDFTKPSALDHFKITGGKVPTGADGAVFTIEKEGDAPTLTSNFYLFYGEVSIEMKTSHGQGIVSSAFLQSDDKDEIDWEALGTRTDSIETNYFGKGDTTTWDRESWEAVATPHDVYHTYTIKWSKEAIVWMIDGQPLRTVTYGQAQGGARYPQTPMNVRLGIWAGGAPTNPQGTIDWAGGPTDYSKGPYSMYIKSVNIVNYNPADSYTWTDKSGSSDSIKFTGSDAVKTRSTTIDATTSSEDALSTTSESPSTTTESPSTTESSSSAATTLATRTSTSSAAESTVVSSSTSTSSAADTSSSAASPSGSSRPSSPSSPSTSGSDSGSSSSSTSSPSSPSSSSSASSSASASASPVFNAGASIGATYLGPVSLLGLLTAMLQL
ncbi:hypothetical protein N7457_005121 [Penicillium paradoxum]|uniref:uncharacterized protein n=1 Tax=Penicillium paradoxum TaxID=176176 RepID=UPI002548A472|nr:uncharacterized protein N7457_005121 [Penicillium paradoxum]KAJ5779961.1 hypothetical protein N7457_005121 [Penicillium paradoxum]